MNHIPTRTEGNGAKVHSRIVSDKYCKVAAIVGDNNGADKYVHIHESATVPANGTTPRFRCPADGGRAFAFSLPMAIDMSACTVVFSTTWETTTITTGTADAAVQGILLA